MAYNAISRRYLTAIEVTDYFARDDGRVDEWHFGTTPADERATNAPFRVPRFHRTLSGWMNLLVASGFAIEHLGEPMADNTAAAAFPAVADTQVAPLFLHVRARKAV